MKTITMPVGNTGVLLRITNLKKTAAQILNKFCNDKVKEAKLATKSFLCDFDFYGYHSTSTKKSIDKLNLLFKRDLAKAVPFIVFASPEYTTTYASNNSDIFRISLRSRIYTTKVKLNQDAVDSGDPVLFLTSAATMGDVYKDHVRTCEMFDRYCRFLNKRCVDGKLTLKTSHSSLIRFTDEFITELNQFTKKDIKDKVEVECRYTVDTLFTFSLGFWNIGGSLGTFTSIPRALRDCSPDELDSGFTCVEKMFGHLNDLRKPLRTLIRKTSYDTDAFVIGNI